MGPAEDNEPATPAKRIGQVVDVAGVGSVARDPDQVSGRVNIDGLVVFINQRHPVGTANESGQVGHGELNEVVELASPESFDKAVLGSDQQDPHGVCQLLDIVGRLRTWNDTSTISLHNSGDLTLRVMKPQLEWQTGVAGHAARGVTNKTNMQSLQLVIGRGSLTPCIFDGGPTQPHVRANTPKNAVKLAMPVAACTSVHLESDSHLKFH